MRDRKKQLAKRAAQGHLISWTGDDPWVLECSCGWTEAVEASDDEGSFEFVFEICTNHSGGFYVLDGVTYAKGARLD